jgi:hypothetical protein
MFSTIYVWRNDVVEKNRDQYQMRFWDWMIIHIINVAEERYREAELICLAPVERMQKTLERDILN